MMRALVFLALAAAAAAGAVWLSDQPSGRVSIVWLGWRMDSTAAVLAVLALAFALAVALILRVLRGIWAAPRRLVEARRTGRRTRGYRALTQGMVAVAAGDAGEAKRQSKKAAVLLDEPPLTLLLSAQSAQLNGDEQAAKRFFAQMLDRKETAFLGLRGLLRQALDAGDKAEALRLAEQAEAQRPDTPWLLPALLELQVAAGQWNKAEETLKRASRRKNSDPRIAARQMAAILVERARADAASGDAAAAVSHALKALKADPDFSPAACEAVARLAADGRARKASRTARNAWARLPHPGIGAAYLAARPGDNAIERMRALEQLTASNPEHLESRIALAEAALAAELWGEARRHLEPLVADGVAASARACRLMAEIEKAQNADLGAAERWRARADEAAPDPAWVCGKCGAAAGRWSAVCAACGAFASLDWRQPPRIGIIAPPTPQAAPAARSPPEAAEQDTEGDLAIPVSGEPRPNFAKNG